MKLGDTLANWMRTGIPPSEQDIQMIANVLNSVQLNNVPASNWPTLNGIDFNDIPKQVPTTLASLGLDADLATLSLPASTTITTAGAALLDDANAGAQLTTLGVTAAGKAILDDASAADQLVTLGAKANYVSATDKLLGRASAGAGAIEEIALTAAGRAILDDATAAAQLATLGITVPSLTGWLSAGTWTYASARTVTVASGAASIYNVGCPLRWKEGGAYKYGYISDVADTLLTIVGNTFAGGAITDNYYSNGVIPLGFPQWFTLTGPTWAATGNGFTNQPTNLLSVFCIIGRTLLVNGVAQCNATSGATGIFAALFTSGEFPTFGQTVVKSSMNLSTSKSGLCWINNANQNYVWMCLYDGTTLATNSNYFIYSAETQI